jgi:D-alanine-D-alanine ligase
MSARAFGKVAVLMGGPSAEREVSLRSGMAVLGALQRSGVDAHGIDAGRDVLKELEQGGFERAFNILHGPWGEDGVIQGALELIGMPYTGSGVLASALSMDKLRSRQLLHSAGVPTPPSMVLADEADFDDAVRKLGLPMAVKPNGQGSSIGVSKVTAAEDLPRAWEIARELDELVLAESWVSGKELHAAILDGEALPLVWVEAAGGIYDYEAKYNSNTTRYHCPSGLDEELERRVQELALEAFRLLGCHGWGRVDILLDHEAHPYVLEMNTLPGMTDHSLVPMAARQAGMGFDELVIRILESSNGKR